MEIERRKEIEKKLARLKRHNHICLLYENPLEQFSVTSTLFKFGFNRNNRCIYVNSETDDEDVVKNIDRFIIGVDIKKKFLNNDFRVLPHKDFCGKNRGLDTKSICQKAKKEYIQASMEGYDGITLTLEMSNIAGSDTSLDKFRDHEIKFNNLLEENNMVGICQYNINRFPSAYIKYMIFCHPLVIYKDCRRFFEI